MFTKIFIRSDESKIASYIEELSTISKDKYKRIYYLSEGLLKLSKENKKELAEKYEIAKKEYTNDLLEIVENREELEAYKELTYLYPDIKKYSDKVIEIEQKKKNTEEAEIAKKSLKFNTIYSAKEAVKLRLKDAESAEFRNVVFVNNTSPVVCGEVNSKNSYGGYAGFSKFLSNGTLTLMTSDGSIFVTTWNKLCAK